MSEPSAEQREIIKKLKTNNIKVQAVAGSGKTTTALQMAQAYKNKKFLLLTYNNRLAAENSQKVEDYGIENIDVYTFHAFGEVLYEIDCKTDLGIVKIVEEDLLAKNADGLEYDVIIVDEVQDMKQLYFEFVTKFLHQVYYKSRVCVMGDFRQAIYEFMGTDARYLKNAAQIFTANDLEWVDLQLSSSFRVPKEIADVINDELLKEKFMKGLNEEPNAFEYHIFSRDEIKTYFYNEILPLIKEYGYENVFILNNSVKPANWKGASKLHIRIANWLTREGIPIYLTTGPKKGDEESKNKLIISTFHQSKGLERDLVFVLNFNSNYFQINKRDSYKTLPNILYVAATRAKKKLVLVNEAKYNALYFLMLNNIKKYIKFYGTAEEKEKVMLDIKTEHDQSKSFKKIYKDEKITSFLPYEVVRYIDKRINFTTLVDSEENFLQTVKPKVPFYRDGNRLYENVEQLTKQILLNYYKYQYLKYPNEMLDYLDEKLGIYSESKDFKIIPSWASVFKDKYLIWRELNDFSDFMKVVNLYYAIKDDYSFKMYHLREQDYTWLTETEALQVAEFLKETIGTGIVPGSITGQLKSDNSYMNLKLNSKYDYYNEKTNALFKVVYDDKVLEEEIYQAVCLNFSKKYAIKEIDKFKDASVNIINIKNREIIRCEMNDMQTLDVVQRLIQASDYDHMCSDEEFLNNCDDIVKKYQNLDE